MAPTADYLQERSISISCDWLRAHRNERHIYRSWWNEDPVAHPPLGFAKNAFFLYFFLSCFLFVACLSRTAPASLWLGRLERKVSTGNDDDLQDEATGNILLSPGHISR